MTQSDDHLFVYGTLMRAFSHPVGQLLRTHATFMSNADIAGQLFHFGAYPGLVESTDTKARVHGELYRLDHRDNILAFLDEYEGCGQHAPSPHLFVRKIKTVRIGSAVEQLAWVYFYNLRPTNGVLIADGRFNG